MRTSQLDSLQRGEAAAAAVVAAAARPRKIGVACRLRARPTARLLVLVRVIRAFPASWTAPAGRGQQDIMAAPRSLAPQSALA